MTPEEGNEDRYYNANDYLYYKENLKEEALKPKSMIDDYSIKNFKKGKLLGEGSFGKVYEGFEESRGQVIAIKEFELSKIPSKLIEEKLESFNAESQILATLNHPNIVKFYGTQKTQSTFNIFLEFVIGGSIAKMLETYKVFPEQIIRKYTKQILLGLEYLHMNNVIHRDIKGANILVDRDGTCKLSDFGGAKVIVDELEFKIKNSLKGTPNWMAPETIKLMEYSRFSDIWAVGCTVIEMATGNPPFNQFKNPMAALYNIMNVKEPPELPEELNISKECREFIRHCMMIDPKHRWNVRKLLQHDFITKKFTRKRVDSSYIRPKLSLIKNTNEEVNIPNSGKEDYNDNKINQINLEKTNKSLLDNPSIYAKKNAIERKKRDQSADNPTINQEKITKEVQSNIKNNLETLKNNENLQSSAKLQENTSNPNNPNNNNTSNSKIIIQEPSNSINKIKMVELKNPRFVIENNNSDLTKSNLNNEKISDVNIKSKIDDGESTIKEINKNNYDENTCSIKKSSQIIEEKSNILNNKFNNMNKFNNNWVDQEQHSSLNNNNNNEMETIPEVNEVETTSKNLKSNSIANTKIFQQPEFNNNSNKNKTSINNVEGKQNFQTVKDTKKSGGGFSGASNQPLQNTIKIRKRNLNKNK